MHRLQNAEQLHYKLHQSREIMFIDMTVAVSIFNVFNYNAVCPRIEPITSTMPSGWATSYATVTGSDTLI